jgi:hypothetical protein
MHGGIGGEERSGVSSGGIPGQRDADAAAGIRTEAHRLPAHARRRLCRRSRPSLPRRRMPARSSAITWVSAGIPGSTARLVLGRRGAVPPAMRMSGAIRAQPVLDGVAQAGDAPGVIGFSHGRAEGGDGRQRLGAAAPPALLPPPAMRAAGAARRQDQRPRPRHAASLWAEMAMLVAPCLDPDTSGRLHRVHVQDRAVLPAQAATSARGCSTPVRCWPPSDRPERAVPR